MSAESRFRRSGITRSAMTNATRACIVLEIDKTECITLGSLVTVGINYEGRLPVGGYDMLIKYDVSAFSFVNATIGPAISGWEYFTYRLGPFGNCTRFVSVGVGAAGCDCRCQQRRESSAGGAVYSDRSHCQNHLPRDEQQHVRRTGVAG